MLKLQNEALNAAGVGTFFPVRWPPEADDRSLNAHSVLTGARVVGRREDGLTAFFQVFGGPTRVGGTWCAAAASVTTPLTLEAGGGFDFPLTSRWSERLTADYLRISTTCEPTYGFRAAVGWVVSLSR